MLKFGDPEYLECSSKGDKRFSALYARIRWRRNQTIEELYQAYKLFDGFEGGLTIKNAKGKPAINMEACRNFYTMLWDEYFRENPELLIYARTFSGFSDIFGQVGHACQAEEIYRISTLER